MARKKEGGQPPKENAPHQRRSCQRPMEEVMHISMIPYAEHVILERALPRVEDGLKPVQRRILYTMQRVGHLPPDKPHRKVRAHCRRLPGQISIRMAIARFTTPWCAWRRPSACARRWWTATATSVRIDGDSAAAMRYTEARMTAAGAGDAAGYRQGYRAASASTSTIRSKEPDMLPGALIRTCWSTAPPASRSGLATNIPPHNLRRGHRRGDCCRRLTTRTSTAG